MADETVEFYKNTNHPGGFHPDIWDKSDDDFITFFDLLAADGFINYEQAGELGNYWSGAEPIVPKIVDIPTQTQREIGFALFERISVFFRAMWDTIFDNLAKHIKSIGIEIGKFIYAPRLRIAQMLFVESDWTKQRLKYTPDGVKLRISRLKKEPTVTDAFVVAVYAVLYDLGVAIGYIGATYTEASHKVNKELSPEIPDIGTLLTVYMRYDGDRNLVINKAKELGYDVQEIELFLKAIHPILDPFVLRDLFLRGKIDKQEHDLRLYQQGYNTRQIEMLRETYKYIPSPQDLVRMAVREAWAEDYAKYWGADQQYPPEFEQWAAKQGMTPYWSKRFWRAHWDIPSVQQGFEMLHRGIINHDELDSLMKALDIMPGWRERLLNISYMPLTRVDVRRMYQTGVLTQAEVYEAYQNLGYNDKNAERMTEFTIRYTSEKERDLAKGDILSVYQRRMINEDTAQGLLINMGYDPIEASVLTARIDYDIAKKERDSITKNLGKAYKNGILSESEVTNRAISVGFTRQETEQLTLQWDIEKRDNYRMLSKSELDKLIGKGIISKDEYFIELHNLNYSDKHIDWLMKLV